MYGTYGSLSSPHSIVFFFKSTLLFLFRSLSTVIHPHLFLSMSCFTSDSSYTTSSHLGVNMIHVHIHTTEYSGLASTLTEMSSLSFAINIF